MPWTCLTWQGMQPSPRYDVLDATVRLELYLVRLLKTGSLDCYHCVPRQKGWTSEAIYLLDSRRRHDGSYYMQTVWL